jgi:DGQHR domain-containing protein
MREIRVPALQIVQSPNREIYSFGVDGKMLHRIASVSRIGREDDASIRGYQRPEVLAHILAIRSYIESESPMIPNGIVVAFDSRVRFEPMLLGDSGATRSGSLVIPLDEDDRPGWIVDGQQRAAAIRDARIDSFPIFVNAFITEEVAEQRAQFILVNSTKPLPKGLIHELLPSTDAPLPLALHKKRLPALILERLNHDDDSPLRGRIRTPTSAVLATNDAPPATIKDNSILKMLENSLSDGVLYSYRFGPEGHPDIEGMLRLLKRYWSAVASVFSDAWDKKPRESRLTHGLGIVSLGYVMDAIAAEFDEVEPETEDFATHLQLIKAACAWTGGFWKLGPYKRAWNDLQNTPRDVQVVADHLLTTYRRRLRAQRDAEGDEAVAAG